MRINKCLFCGSSNLRADRALSGRLICTSCGNPYGVKRIQSNNRSFVNRPIKSKIKFILLIILISFLVILFL